MAAVMSRSSAALMSALAFLLCILAQASLSTATNSAEFEAFLKKTKLPQVSLPPLPSLSHLSFPGLPQFSLPPLPSRVTVPGFTLPGFSIPPVEPWNPLNLPTFPQPSVTLPEFPGIDLPATTVLPPFGSFPALTFPGVSVPPIPSQTFTSPPLFTIPGFTFQTVSVPPTSFPFPRRVYPRSHTKVIKN